LGGVGTRLRLYTNPEQRRVERRLAEEEEATALARRTSVVPAAVAPVLARVGERLPSHAVPVVELARRQKVPLRDLFAASAVGTALSADAVLTADLDIKYDGYLARERAAADRLRRLGGFALPGDAPYAAMRTLSVEARQKLTARRPATLAQAAGIPGVTPADLQNLVLEVERWQRG
jgi:tRNA uridine 5-carboxymethylaminomethyl modification enzyme